MTTTTNGTYMFCDADLSFSMTFTCAGPSCTSLLSHNNLTCTQSSPQSWNCTNGVTCASATAFTSKFSIAQPNNTMSQSQIQNVSLNGTSFVFQQDAEGNVKLSNGTTTSAASTPTSTATTTTSSTSSAASASASTSGGISSRASLSTLFLCAMLLLSIFTTTIQAQVTGASVGKAVDTIFQSLDKIGDGKSAFDVGASGMAKAFNDIAVKTCSAFVGQGAGGLSGLSLAYGQCEEALFSAEVSLIAGSLNITSYNNYTGLGGAQATSLSSSGETMVRSVDEGALPELFIANSALCGLLVVAIQQTVLSPSSENLCSALEGAAVRHESTSTSAIAASSTIPPTASNSQSASTTATQSSSSPASTAANGTLPSSLSMNSCLDCFLNTYLDSLNVLSGEACNNAPPTFASAYDLSGFFCDPSITPSTADSTAFCKSLCVNPCAKFEVQAIVQALGANYVKDPAANDVALGKLCNVCGPEGEQSQKPDSFKCAKPVPDCLCGIGAELCTKGCPGL